LQMQIKLVYLDTSVIGGCFDEEFRVESSKLMEMIRLGIYVGMISPISLRELEGAPPSVRAIMEDLDDDQLIRLADSDRVDMLTRAYLSAEIVPKRYSDDAGHIAFATVNKADVLVSWNFKHIVNLRRIEAFNAINEREGYHQLEIRTPRELFYGKEEEGL
jgi:hypothetical protein